MAERQINVEGVPAPFIRAMEIIAEAGRKFASNGNTKEQKRVELPVWKLGVKHPIRREDFYDEAG